MLRENYVQNVNHINAFLAFKLFLTNTLIAKFKIVNLSKINKRFSLRWTCQMVVNVDSIIQISMYIILIISAWFPVILGKSWWVPHVGPEMLTLSGTSDFTPFVEFMISPIHYIYTIYYWGGGGGLITECVSIRTIFTD